MEITGIFEDKVAWKGVEINPGKTTKFLIEQDGRLRGFRERRVRLNSGSRGPNSFQATSQRLT